jgi:hypothetical protein
MAIFSETHNTAVAIPAFVPISTAAVPDNDRLIMDKAGNLLGTTLFGGPDNIGVVFRVAP